MAGIRVLLKDNDGVSSLDFDNATGWSWGDGFGVVRLDVTRVEGSQVQGRSRAINIVASFIENVIGVVRIDDLTAEDDAS